LLFAQICQGGNSAGHKKKHTIAKCITNIFQASQEEVRAIVKKIDAVGQNHQKNRHPPQQIKNK
jgi:hypothetical protein